MTQSDQPRLYALDGLRSACAMSIVAYHASMMVFGRDIIPSAFVAVDLFFIMSGYVVALAYEQRLRSGMGLGAFANARLARLGPTYLVGAAVAAVVATAFAASGILSPASATVLVMAGFLLMPAPSRFSEAYGVNGPVWSLFAEVIVNVVYASVACRLSTRRIFILVLAGYILIGLLAAHSADGYNFGWRWTTLYQAPIRALAPYFAGVLIFRLSSRPAFQRLPDLSPFLVIMVFGFGQFLSPTLAPAWVMSTTVGVVGALMVAVLVRTTQQPVTYAGLGRLSYPLYATHYPILKAFEQFRIQQPGEILDPLVGLTSVALVVVVAVATDQIVRQWPLPRGVAQPSTTRAPLPR